MSTLNKIIFTTMILCFLVSPVMAFDPWTGIDTGFQTTVVALQIIDWKQTRSIAKDESHWEHEAPWAQDEHHRWAEYGPAKYFIGDYPSVNNVNWYFAGSIVGHTAIARVLPNPYRRIWQCIFIAAETKYVAHNYRVGVRFNW